MATSALLDADFGSESEDDNFNPAPADVSDNDAIGESDTEDPMRSNGNTSEQTRPTIQGDGHERDDKHGAGVKQHNDQSRRESRDDGDGAAMNGTHDVNGDGENDAGVGDRDVDEEDEEEDDEDEDDEDDEEAVSVSRHNTQFRKVQYKEY